MSEKTKYILCALTEAECNLAINMVKVVNQPVAIQFDPAERDELLQKLMQPPATTLPAAVIQRLIITRLVKDMLAAGYEIAVNDSEDMTLPPSKNAGEIVARIFDPAVDDDRYTLHICKGGDQIGWVLLIDGNGWSVISDYSLTLEVVLSGANALADELEEFDI